MTVSQTCLFSMPLRVWRVGYPVECPLTGICLIVFFSFYFFQDFIHSFMRDTGRGRSRLHAGSLMWDSIPGSLPELKADAQPLSRPGVPLPKFLMLLAEIIPDIPKFLVYSVFVVTSALNF